MVRSDRGKELKMEDCKQVKEYSLVEEEDMRRWLEAAGGVLVLWGGVGASEGRGGAGGGVWAGGRGGAGGGAGGSSLSPVPFSTTGEVSAGSSNSTEPCREGRKKKKKRHHFTVKSCQSKPRDRSHQ